MKQLKLEHHLAALVLAGSKWTTWRFFDDKELAVDDKLLLIDKVDARNPQTWVGIGVATVYEVITKIFGEINAHDLVGHEPFAHKEEMLATYRKYYGPAINWGTPVKVVRFRLDNGVFSKTKRLTIKVH